MNKYSLPGRKMGLGDSYLANFVKAIFVESKKVKQLATIAMLIFSTACSPGHREPNFEKKDQIQECKKSNCNEGKKKLVEGGVWISALKPESDLYLLASKVNNENHQTSPFHYSALGVEGEISTARLENFPQLKPVSSIRLKDKKDVQFGLEVNQKIWDGGRLKYRMEILQQKRDELKIEDWIYRNEKVYENIEKYVTVAVSREKLMLLDDLERELNRISLLIQKRNEAGVSDGGEVLKISTSIHQLHRKKISNTTSVSNAKRDIAKYFTSSDMPSKYPKLVNIVGQCQRSSKDIISPEVQLSEIKKNQVLLKKRKAVAQRYPRASIYGNITYSDRKKVISGIGINFDTNDHWGVKGKRILNSLDEEILASKAREKMTQLRIEEELLDLDDELLSLQMELPNIRKLEKNVMDSISLYDDQLTIGSIALMEGVELHNELYEVRASLIESMSYQIYNCLKRGLIQGLLASPVGLVE